MILPIRLICFHIPFLRSFLKYPIELHVIRHAESNRNVAMGDNYLIGSSEEMEKISEVPDHHVDITSTGYDQSFLSGPGILKKIGIPDIIITSGYLRTDRTLAGIKDGMLGAWDNVPVNKDFAIRERETGYTWRLIRNETEEHFPYLQPHWKVVGNVFSRPPGGESIMDVIEKRLYRFFDKMCQKYSGKKVCLVSHGRIKTCFRAIIEELSLDEIEEILVSPEDGPKNVSVTSYKYNPLSDKLELESYNVVYH